MKRTMISCIVGMLVALGLWAQLPEGWSAYDLSSGTLTVANEGKVWVTGSGNTIVVPDDVTCDLLLQDVKIETPSGASPIKIGARSKVNLRVVGTNTLTGVKGFAAIVLDADNAALTILSDEVDTRFGVLTVKGGWARPGIQVLEGSTFTLAATQTVVYAEGGAKEWDGTDNVSAAGVGSYAQYNSGTVIIKEGRLEATGGQQAAGIGAGTSNGHKCAGSCGDVIIEGGYVIALGNKNGWACGIGGGVPWLGKGGNLKSYTQTGGIVYAKGCNSPGLGGATGGMKGDTTSSFGGDVLGTIRVSGGQLYASCIDWNEQLARCPAIGGGGIRDASGNYTKSSSGGTIIFEGTAQVEATGTYLGIGSGGYASTAPTEWNTAGTTLVIDGADVKATGGMWSVGGAEQVTSVTTNLLSVTITGGNFYAPNGVQVQPTNGEALGNRKLYPVSMYPTDKPPFYVQARDGGQAYEYSYIPSDKGWWYNGWHVLWLPVGTHEVCDQSNVRMCVDVSTPEEPIVYTLPQSLIVRLTDQSRNVIITTDGKQVTTEGIPYFYAMRRLSENDTTTITLSNCVAQLKNKFINVGDWVTLNLYLVGNNELVSSNVKNGGSSGELAPICVYANGHLNMYGPGYLKVAGNYKIAAIGQSSGASCGSISIYSGTIDAYGGCQAAAIGCGLIDGWSGTCGDVAIHGGVVRAYGFLVDSQGKMVAGSGWSAGIGGATAWDCNGGSLKSYTQTGGDVEVYGETAAAIGGGGAGKTKNTPSEVMALRGGNCGPVKITGGRLLVDNVTYNLRSENCTGAGIGGAGGRVNSSFNVAGAAGYLTSYEQTGGTVIVKGDCIGIGGGGETGAIQGEIKEGNTTVKVTGGTLTVNGSVYAIGGQETATSSITNLTKVAISGGSVKLTGGVQIPIVNENGTPVYEAVTKKSAIAPGQQNIDVAFKVTDTQDYTYAYQGAGHTGDDACYFWLPNGRFVFGKSGGTMTNGSWSPFGGITIYLR